MDVIVRFIDAKIADLEQEMAKYVASDNDYIKLNKFLEEMPDMSMKDVVVPFEKKSSETGKLAHTDELAAIIGEDWSAEMSTKQALHVVDLRIDNIRQNIKRIDAQIKDLSEKKSALPELNEYHQKIVNEDGLPIIDIQEVLDDEDNIISSNVPIHPQSTANPMTAHSLDELHTMIDKIELDEKRKLSKEAEITSYSDEEEIDDFEQAEYDELAEMEHIVGELNIEYSSGDDDLEYSDIPTDESEDEYGMTKYTLPEKPVLTSEATGTRRVRFEEGTVDNEKLAIPEKSRWNRRSSPVQASDGDTNRVAKKVSRFKQERTSRNESCLTDKIPPEKFIKKLSSPVKDTIGNELSSDHKISKIPVKSEIVEHAVAEPSEKPTSEKNPPEIKSIVIESSLSQDQMTSPFINSIKSVLKKAPAKPVSTQASTIMKMTVIEHVEPEQVSDDDLNADLHEKEIAIEYHRLRQKMIAEKGGYIEYDGEILPLHEEYIEDGNGKKRKMSRFKAARLDG
ncbi:Unconventional prefoldin RPB5 interactor [Neolecta irregularis DAH-3]|uniref:Unconventional prefoldin RPB5 interactor n=1 Tax=Neolecta irregularis (strain DAH-3) TaxID=1198029 RepID=A0A1U7LQQ7_NEOID|nr:Unconventional prefoldin RPB5 interactor [Neolecta irregularis DAH-3]|eukprot:OLL25006.1 Unconventional prefoldin RPB5 interactor [Neolecta irregularis DAH-3]